MNEQYHQHQFDSQRFSARERQFADRYKTIEDLIKELSGWRVFCGNEVLQEEEMDNLVDLAVLILDEDHELIHILEDKKLFQIWKKIAEVLYNGVNSHKFENIREKISNVLVRILKIANPKTNRGPGDTVMSRLFDRWPWSELKYKPKYTEKSASDEAILKKYFGQFGIDAEVAFNAWYASQEKVLMTSGLLSANSDPFCHPVGTALENTKEMRRLELQHSGGVKTLVEKFGVYCFCRYPKGLLDEQLEQIDDNSKPYGVYISSKSDHNACGYKKNSIQSCESLWQQCKRLGINLRVVEAGNQRELRKRFFFLEKKYNIPCRQKAVFGIANGHANKYAFFLGGNKEKLGAISVENILYGNFIADSKRFFADGAYFVINGCLTGQEGGIAKTGSVSMPHLHVLACPEDISSIHYTLTSEGGDSKIPKFSVNYTRGFSFERPMVHYKGEI